MATVTEIVTSGRAQESEDSPTRERRYHVAGEDDEDDAIAAVLSFAPGTLTGLVRETCTVEPIDGYSWWATVTYSAWIDESEFTFDTTGGSEHINLSLETVGTFNPAGEAAADHKGAIGKDEDSVKGTDITVPVYAFTERHKINDSLVDGTYKATLFALTGTVNDGNFKGFAKGEVLFMGATGRKRGTEKWDIEFRFAASPNIADFDLGDIEAIAKEGWHYLWCEFIDDKDDAAKVLIKKPRQVNVERVYEYGDLSAIGIGS